MLYVASSSQSIVYPINRDISLFCFDLKVRVRSTGQLEPNFQWILFTSHFRVEFLESEKKKKIDLGDVNDGCARAICAR
jgi:hypothetical protein